MQHITLRNKQQFSGGFTDLFILGTTRVVDAGTFAVSSDFTAAATTQSYNLLALAVGDAVVYPLAHVLVKTAIAGTGWSSVKCDVGTTDGATTLNAGTAGDLSTINFVRASAAASAPYSCQATSKYVTALITNGGAGLMTAITAGEVWVYVAVARVRDWLTERQA